MARKNRIARNVQLSKAERELLRLEKALAPAVVRVGTQGSGVHRRENYRHGGKSAQGGRGQGERRAIAQAS